MLESSQDPDVYTRQYANELRSLISKHILTIKKNVGISEVEVDLILYTPWFTSKINSVNHTKRVIIDNVFLQNTINEIDLNTHLKTIEKKILKIQVNGYPLTEFTKVKSSNLKIDCYTSFIADNLYTLFKKIITDNFSFIKNINVYTSPILILDTVKKFMIQEDNIISIYIGGEITELSIIKDDSLVYFATFPIGKHDFLRSLNTTIKTYDYDLLSQQQIQIKSKKQEMLFEKIKTDWSQSICDLLHHFNQHLPSKLLILTDAKTRPFFINLITNSINQNTESLLKNHRIINFDISMFKDIISYKTPIGDNEVDLIIEALI
jgi:hypothetical protein